MRGVTSSVTAANPSPSVARRHAQRPAVWAGAGGPAGRASAGRHRGYGDPGRMSANDNILQHWPAVSASSSRPQPIVRPSSSGRREHQGSVPRGRCETGGRGRPPHRTPLGGPLHTGSAPSRPADADAIAAQWPAVSTWPARGRHREAPRCRCRQHLVAVGRPFNSPLGAPVHRCPP